MCHSSRHRAHHRASAVRGAGPSAPETAAPDSAAPERSDLRASDAERERTVDALRGHAAAGRLEPDELEERLGRALAARSRGDLAALLADLPEAPRPRAAAAPSRHRSHHRKDPRAFLPIAALLVVIWAVTGMGYFWPVWPLLWFAFAGAMHWRPGNTRVIGNTAHTQ